MADNNVVHIGENSPEKIAFELLKLIMESEYKQARGKPVGVWTKADRQYILDTYAESLNAVKGYRSPSK